ncbi:acyl carrier protein [Rhizobiaceae sp. 2RAB30]
MKRLVALFAETLNLPSEAIRDDISPNNTVQWDSLANLLLIASIEETYEIDLTADELEAMRDFGMVRTLLKARGVGAPA